MTATDAIADIDRQRAAIEAALAELAAREAETVVLAGDATPGFYLSKKGRVLRIVARSQVSSRWDRVRGFRVTDVPYRSYADPQAKCAEEMVDVFGWLPVDYPLRPTQAPSYVSTQMAERAARLSAALGRPAPAPPAPAAAPLAPRAAGQRDPRLPLPGAVLARSYKGKMVQCVVGATDFEVAGRRYRTLSAAAQSITGGAVNGFAFFGLTR